MSEEDISNEKFKDILKSSYQTQEEAGHTLAKHGYSYDPDLSTMESKVFVDANGNPSIAYRGSTRVSDFLVEDPALAFGIKTEKQKKAEQLARDVETKYGKPADTYGHSLASFRAEKANTGGKIYTYNRAVGIKDIGKKLDDRHTDVRTDKDIVSILSLTQTGGKRITLKTSPFTSVIGSHGLNQLDNKPKSKSIFNFFG